jgi:6-phosphogluconolactonase/glucosamine-6-phosphate isomerase/deaminase
MDNLEISSLVRSFDSTKELDAFIVELMITEFQKPGLILLPVGNTFEAADLYNLGIYPKVNDYFKLYKPHSELKLSHLDELIDNMRTTFSSRLKQNLPDLIGPLEDSFYAINIDDMEGFDRFVKQCGGPRIIFAGLGTDPSTHVAFIGEDYINTTTAVVELSSMASLDHNCSRAVTIGTDIFNNASLEAIIVVAKGGSKADPLQAAFADADTGLGYLIKHHASKLKIYTDHEVMGK